RTSICAQTLHEPASSNEVASAVSGNRHLLQLSIQVSRDFMIAVALPYGPPAVDREALAGHIGRQIARQIGDRPLDILLARHPRQRCAGHIAAQKGFPGTSEDPTRRDRIDPDL